MNILFNYFNKLDVVEREFVFSGFGLVKVTYAAHGYEFRGWITQDKFGMACYKIGELAGEWPFNSGKRIDIASISRWLVNNKWNDHKATTRLATFEIFFEANRNKIIVDRSFVNNQPNNPVENLILLASLLFPYQIKSAQQVDAPEPASPAR